MKARFFWMALVVAGLFAGGLTACGKKAEDSSNSLTYQSLASDGNTVTSKNTTVSGVPLDLTIRNITAYGGTSTQNAYNNPYSYYYGYNNTSNGIGTVRFDIIINGASQSMSVTSTWSQITVGNWRVWGSGACYDYSCQVVMLTVAVNPLNVGYGGYYGAQATDYRQIAVKKDMRSNRVIALREYSMSGSQQGWTVDQLMREMP